VDVTEGHQTVCSDLGKPRKGRTLMQHMKNLTIGLAACAFLVFLERYKKKSVSYGHSVGGMCYMGNTYRVTRLDTGNEDTNLAGFA